MAISLYWPVAIGAGTQQKTRCIVVTYSHESTENTESVDRQNTQQSVCCHKNTHNVVPVVEQTTRCIVVTYSHESTENIASVDR